MIRETLLALFLVALTRSASSQRLQIPPEQLEAQRVAMEQAGMLMDQCDVSRKAKRFDQAEQQCRAAIQILQSSGWPAAGETQTLGMIIFEKGQKREGFKIIKSALLPLGSSLERELFLARAALEVGDYVTAKQIVDFYAKEGSRGPANKAKAWWPKGDNTKVLQANLCILEGSRLIQGLASPEWQEGIAWMKKADSLFPRNVAISYVLGTTYFRLKEYKLAAPYLKVVALNGAAPIQRPCRENYNQIAEYIGEKRIDVPPPPVRNQGGGSRG